MNLIKWAEFLADKYTFSRFIEQADELWMSDPMKYYVYDEQYEENPDYLILTLTIGILPDEEHAETLPELSDEQLKGGIVRLGKKFKQYFSEVVFDVQDDLENFAKLLIVKVPNIKHKI